MEPCYLNERVMFACAIGNNVIFEPVGGDPHLKIQGSPILTTGTKLRLAVPPVPGQCILNPLPNGTPGPCQCYTISGSWINKSNLKLPSGNALVRDCSNTCKQRGGKLSPFSPSFVSLLKINKDARISGISDIGNFKSTEPENRESVSKQDSVGSSDSSKIDNQVQVKNSQNTHAVVSGDEKKEEEQNNDFCAKCGTRKECDGCAFLKTSDVEQVRKLRSTLEKNCSRNEKIDAYNSSNINTTDAIHHVISINQGFNKRDIKTPNIILRRVANFFDYDINSSGNLVRLPTFVMFEDLSAENIIDVAVDMMNKTKAQFHLGHHNYQFTKALQKLDKALERLESSNETTDSELEHAAIFKEKKSSKDSVIEQLDRAVSKLEHAQTKEEKISPKEQVIKQLEDTRTILEEFKSFVYLTELIRSTCQSLKDDDYRLDQIKGLKDQIIELKKQMEKARDLLNSVKPYERMVKDLINEVLVTDDELGFLDFSKEKVKCCILQKKNENKNFFQQIMDGMADEIRPELIDISKKRNRNAGQYFFVSKLAIYYAYRDVLEKFKLDLDLASDGTVSND